MARRTISLLIILTICFVIVSAGYTKNANLSRQEVEEIIEEVARKRGIPSIIMKCIAKVESNFRQFNESGKPYLGAGRYVGIMQVDGWNGVYDADRLNYDPIYNIEAGADHLLGKWKVANDKMTQIGDMDPNILEHWYFALWGYNGLLDRNDPNKSSKTYQDKIYDVALRDYEQEISGLNKKTIPSRGGFPRNDKRIETPEECHEGDIIKFQPGDIVISDTMEKANGKAPLVLHDEARGNAIGTVGEEQLMLILEDPVLKRGFYFYKVQIAGDSREGWVYGNWITLVDREEDMKKPDNILVQLFQFRGLQSISELIDDIFSINDELD